MPNPVHSHQDPVHRTGCGTHRIWQLPHPVASIFSGCAVAVVLCVTIESSASSSSSAMVPDSSSAATGAEAQEVCETVYTVAMSAAGRTAAAEVATSVCSCAT